MDTWSERESNGCMDRGVGMNTWRENGYSERGDGMDARRLRMETLREGLDTWREGKEWIHEEMGWNGYVERGDGMDT